MKNWNEGKGKAGDGRLGPLRGFSAAASKESVNSQSASYSDEKRIEENNPGCIRVHSNRSIRGTKPASKREGHFSFCFRHGTNRQQGIRRCRHGRYNQEKLPCFNSFGSRIGQGGIREPVVRAYDYRMLHRGMFQWFRRKVSPGDDVSSLVVACFPSWLEYPYYCP